MSDLTALMSVIDKALIGRVELSNSNLAYSGWEGIERSEQTPGDRRLNLREIHVFAQLSSL